MRILAGETAIVVIISLQSGVFVNFMVARRTVLGQYRIGSQCSSNRSVICICRDMQSWVYLLHHRVLMLPQDEVVVPTWLPDNEFTRRDIAAQYTAINRLDTGVGLMVNELKRSGHFDSTLIIYLSA